MIESHNCEGCSDAMPSSDPRRFCSDCEQKRERVAMDALTRRLEAEGLAAYEKPPEIPMSQTIAGRLADLGAAMNPEGHEDPCDCNCSPGPLPLPDLRERIAILCAAGVTHYRDAGVELHFDLDARKTGRPEPKTERF